MNGGCSKMKIKGDKSRQNDGSMHNGHRGTKCSNAAIIQLCTLSFESFKIVRFNFRQKTSTFDENKCNDMRPLKGGTLFGR